MCKCLVFVEFYKILVIDVTCIINKFDFLNNYKNNTIHRNREIEGEVANFI